MKYGLRVLHNNQRDLSTCVYLHSGETLYMFNLGDGIQRIASQAKMKFGRVRGIFIPSLLPNNFLGLPGFYLTTRDGMKASESGFRFSIYGPEGFSKKLKDVRYITGTFAGCGEIFEHIEEIKEDMETDEEDIELRTKVSKKNYFEDDEVRVEITSNVGNDGEEFLSYIVIPTQKRGKFIPQEAKKLGCNPKLHFKKLSQGEDVTLENGTVIYSSQVVEKSLPSESFIINFVPDSSYIDSVVSNPKYEEYFEGNISENTSLAIVYHSTESFEIFNNEKYLEFMKKFGPGVKHVIDCRDLNAERIVRYKAMNLSLKYHTICSRLYPLAAFNLIDFYKANYHKVEDSLKEFDVIMAESGLRVELYPAKSAGVFYDDVIKPEHMEDEEEKKITEGILTQNEETKANSEFLKDLDIDAIIPEKKFKNEPEILFCGTISMKPTGSRCASCIYLNIPGDKGSETEEEKYRTTPRDKFDSNYGILLDCSEASYGQLYDHFQDINILNQILVNLRVVWITHMHGDHCMGISKIFHERALAIQKLFSAEDIEKNQDEFTIYACVPYFLENLIKDIPFVKVIPTSKLNPETEKYYFNDDPFEVNECKPKNVEGCVQKSYEECLQNIQQMEDNFDEDTRQFYQVLNSKLGIKRIYGVEAFHCYEAYGCVVEAEDWRILYSGDTMPNQNYLNYGQGITLLIHEATLENGLEDDAKKKNHTTTGQAITVGTSINAWRVCLTHFSPRYVKVSEITQEHFDNKVMSAMDHLRLKLSDFEWAYRTLELYKPFEDL
ncbi:unnamed protein product [Moneuplotes crassus]|uniref:ribonuclease Z n=1 Tax=Euplotes crassus TaxID=5936 RepID=A0AAD1Y5N3_EUPCR|nr:unnamed protein product [Moneuplotes crassus]